jgi:hypothetical protein
MLGSAVAGAGSAALPVAGATPGASAGGAGQVADMLATGGGGQPAPMTATPVAGGAGMGGSAGVNVADAAGHAAVDGCSRESLKAAIDTYFKALAAHDPTLLTKASGVRFTENAKDATLGEGLVWKTAGAAKFTRSLLDTERCGTVTEAVFANPTADTIFGLRLKLAQQAISEIETIVVDPTTGFSPTPAGILNSKADAWEDVLPADQRSTREQLEAAGKAYFARFSDASVQVPFGMPCDRLENGVKTTQGNCSNFGSAMGLKHPAQRYPVTDIEAGITAGFLRFAGADLDFHMFKVIGGKIRWINAVVGPAVSSTGWDK